MFVLYYFFSFCSYSFRSTEKFQIITIYFVSEFIRAILVVRNYFRIMPKTLDYREI